MNNFFGNVFQNGDADHNFDDSFDISGFISRAIPNLSSFAEDMQERIFQRDMAAAVRASMQPESPSPVAASHSSIRQLPTVKVSREDLVDPCNRECCICLEGIHLGNSVLRLPCAHIYHPRCIQKWLTEHGNTCPVCRYELPVDNNPEYEAGRRERMRCRKPRFAQHELDRLSISQLKQLLPASRKTLRFSERRELVDCLIQSGAIDVVATPEPVSYRLSELRQMSISRLKASMSDAGVFFDAKEVVEKSDMIHIFIASGRLRLLDEPEEDRKPAARPTGGLTVETVHATDDHASTVDERQDTSILMEENTDFVQSCAGVDETRRAESTDSPGVSEGVNELSDTGSVSSSHRSFSRKRRRYDRGDMKLSDHYDSRSESTGPDSTLEETVNENQVPSNDNSVPVDESSTAAGPDGASSVVEDLSGSERYESDEEQDKKVGADGTDASADTTYSESLSGSELDGHSISQLRALASAHSVDLSDCLERTEIICRLASRLNLADSRSASSNEPDRQVLFHPLDNWGISEIRALAALSEIDLSTCQSREEIISMLNATAITRPQVANYFQTLAPLAQLSISQLRAVARERQIPVSDCLEKGEIIQRLVQSMRSHPSVF